MVELVFLMLVAANNQKEELDNAATFLDNLEAGYISPINNRSDISGAIMGVQLYRMQYQGALAPDWYDLMHQQRVKDGLES